MKRAILLATSIALAATSTTAARADEEAPPNTHFRLGLVTTPSFVAMRVFDVPVRWVDVPVGIGAIIDDGAVGFEWYGMASFGQGWTRAGRHATSWSPFGSRMIFRVEMVRATLGFRVLGISFEPARGLSAGDGLSGSSALGELGLGVDVLRIFSARPDRVRETITVDGFTQWYGGLGGGVSFAIAIGAHL